METKSINRILVVTLDNLGDAVMASCVFKPLRKIHPQAKISLWAKDYVAGLFAGHPLLETVHASDPFWDKSPGLGKGSFWEFNSVLSDIRNAHYDVAILLNSEWRRTLACSWAGIPVRVGYNRKKSGFFLTNGFPSPKDEQHFVDDHRALLEVWTGRGVSLDDAKPTLQLTPEQKMLGEQWLRKNNLATRNYLLLHLFSGDEEKNWPLTPWTQLMAARLGKDPEEKFVLLCGPGEEKKLGPLQAALNRKEVVLLSAPDLSLLKAVCANARLFIGGDSGPGHVAAALGTPVLSLFGKTLPARSRPIGSSRVLVVQHSPLSNLPVSMVLDAMDQFEARV